MRQSQQNIALMVLYLGILFVASMASRTLIPIDETRYTTVAWEMWLRGDLLVPYLNGATYSHKPPLLFWLFMLGWKLFGVNEWWPRLIPFLFSFGSMLLLQHLGRWLWPERDVYLYAPFILLGFTLWSFFSTAVMFDMMLAFFVLLSITGLYRALSGDGLHWWLLTGIAWGMGMLSKGPVVFVHTLPVLLLVALWVDTEKRPPWRQVFGGFLLAFILAVGVILAWVIPAVLSGGEEYGRSLLLGQNIERALKAPNDALPWWFYLPFLPLILFPWLYWGGSWKAFLQRSDGLLSTDRGMRFCLLWIIPVFLMFTIISGKKVHYLLPLLPAVSLLLANLLLRSSAPQSRLSMLPLTVFYMGMAAALVGIGLFYPTTETPYWLSSISPWSAVPVGLMALAGWWWIRGTMLQQVRLISLQTIIFLALMHAAIFTRMHGYDLRPIAQQIHNLQQQGYTLAHNGKYHGDYHFLGRLQQPLDLVRDHTLGAWMAQHPNDYVISYRYEPCGSQQQPLTYQRLFRNGQCLTIRSTTQERTHLQRRQGQS